MSRLRGSAVVLVGERWFALHASGGTRRMVEDGFILVRVFLT